MKRTTKKKRGRPATGQDAVTSIRLSPDFRDALDRWSRLQPDKPSRSEAIRRIVERSISRKRWSLTWIKTAWR